MRVDVTDDFRKHFWLLADDQHLEVCAQRPQPTDDLVLTTTSAALTHWQVGRISLGRALRDGVMQVGGPRQLVRMLASWGGLGAYETRA